MEGWVFTLGTDISCLANIAHQDSGWVTDSVAHPEKWAEYLGEAASLRQWLWQGQRVGKLLVRRTFLGGVPRSGNDQSLLGTIVIPMTCPAPGHLPSIEKAWVGMFSQKLLLALVCRRKNTLHDFSHFFQSGVH